MKLKNKWDFSVLRGAAIGFICSLFMLFAVKDIHATLIVLIITLFLILLANKRLVNIIRKFFGKKPLGD